MKMVEKTGGLWYNKCMLNKKANKSVNIKKPEHITSIKTSQRFIDSSVEFLSGSRNFTPEEKSGYRNYLNTFFKLTGKKSL